MTIGVICAIPEELEHLLPVMSAVREFEIAHTRFIAGTLDGHALILARGGVGKVNTAITTTLMIRHFDARLVVLSGVAGGLDPALHIGDVVIADRTIQHDAGYIEDGRIVTYQVGHVPFFNPTDRLGFDLPADLRAKVAARLEGFSPPSLSRAAGGDARPTQIRLGTILTGDQYLHCEATRERLFKELGGVAIEMEGAALAQSCEAFGRPWLVIRALSDLAGHDSRIDFNAFVNEVAASAAGILRHLLPVL